MAYRVLIDKRVKKYLNKLKDQHLQRIIVDEIYDQIAQKPFAGDQKSGSLKAYFTVEFRYNETSYRIAYTVDNQGHIIIVLLVGSNENFYKALRRLID